MMRSVSSTAILPSWGSIVIAIMIMATIGFSSGRARAAQVSGVLTGYENSTPLVSRDLHFQNAITGDIYLSPTHSDGSFRASLPPGTYRLRTETGAVLVNSFVVSRSAIDLGRISELAPMAPQRLWQAQSIAPSNLSGPAPSTAYLKTSDTTTLPSNATTVPKPEIDWTKPPPGTQADQGPSTVTGMAAAPLPPPTSSSNATSTIPSSMGPHYSSSSAAPEMAPAMR
jgi:hypothetical protein